MRRLSPLLLAAVFLFGCATGPTIHLDPQTVAAVAGEATRLGSLATLAVHPEFRPQFQQASQAVHTLLALGNFDIGQLTTILKGLSIAEGENGEIGIIIAQGAISVWGLYGEFIMRLDAGSAYGTWVKPIATAIAAGLDQALGQPAKPMRQLPPR